MEFYAVVDKVVDLLRSRGRVSYRGVKRQFSLDDEYLEDLKVEVIEVLQVAVDQEGKMLVWTGETALTPLSPPQTLSINTKPDQQEEQPAPVTRQPTTPRLPEAERRQLTVLFCDLVDSTKLAGQLDPEDLREVVRSYQATSAEVIQRFDGTIAQYLGDGLLVYFGYPQAHEDDAQRAVRASLDIIEAIDTLNTRLEPTKGIRLAVRLGIHTGLVVIGEMGGGDRQEHLALGETPNIAARIQGLATPDTVVISAATARLVQNTCALEDLESHRLKGIEEPVRVFRVLDLLEVSHRPKESTPDRTVFLVGRDEEVGLLRRRWEQSKEGVGQAVFVSGEAGIGKSTLVQTLRTQVVEEGFPRIRFRCSPYHTNSALYPVIEHLQRLLHWEQDDTPAVKLAKMEEVLQRYRFPLEEVVPLMAALLSVPLGDRYPPLTLTPQQQRQQTLDTLVAWLLQEAERQSVLVVWEDLHWADSSTLELLGLVLEQTPTVSMLQVLTFRPEFVPPWPTRTHLTPMTLNRLERLQVEALITHLAGGKSLPTEVMQHIVTKTDGVPLFVEELTKMLLESDLLQEEADHYALTGPLSTVMIPATLQDSLMARLDRLSTGREAAQLGAVLGREFSYEMIQVLAAMDKEKLQQGLAQLVAAELLYQRGRPPRAKYLFKHALIRDAAYASLLKSTRQHYHQQIGQILETQLPDLVETQPELLGHHYTEAGLYEQAIGYWQQAGQRAIQRSANLEAIAHFTKGLELLQTLPDTPKRTQQELDLQIALGPALMATKGYAAPEVEQTYARARVLCQQVGDTPQLSTALWGLYAYYVVRAEHQIARELGEQLLYLAQRVQIPHLPVVVHWALGITLYFCGEFTTSRSHLEQGIALYDPQQQPSQTFPYGSDPGVGCLSWLSYLLWFLGYPDQALQRVREALSFAQQLSHPYTRTYSLHFATQLHQYRREAQATQKHAEALMVLSTEHGFSYYVALGVALGTLVRGQVLAAQGQKEEGITQMQQGLAALRAIGGEMELSRWLGFLVEAYGKTGQIEEGLTLLTEALTLVDKTGEHFYEAELYRLKGELLLQSSIQSPGAGVSTLHSALRTLDLETEAETCFHQALTIAHRQQAKSLELRAAMSLSRLWQQQAKRQEAHELLAPIYDWFTEGFDTVDLQEAKALLDALS